MIEKEESTRAGKLSITELKRKIFSNLGSDNPHVLFGPGLGRDFNVISLNEEQVMLVTTDPFYVNLSFELEDATWLGFQIILSDMLVSGIKPQHAIFSLNLPNNIQDDVFFKIWKVIHEECKKRGISIVSGHTGSYDGCDFPILGSATLMATCNRGEFIAPGNISPGDDILLITGPAKEAFSSLLKVDRTGSEVFFGREYPRIQAAAWRNLSIEKPCEILSRMDGIKAMHDVAERGILGATREMCDGAGVGCQLTLDAWTHDEKVKEFLLHYFSSEEDIWRASGQGGLLVACEKESTKRVLNALAGAGIQCARVGSFKEPGFHLRYVLNGKENMLEKEIVDPFWPIFLGIIESLKE
ncbi:MAG: AIR synthase-related protein [Promethearchaeota archaeon]